jgi:tetratricopeptide (TPR) repeat protein
VLFLSLLHDGRYREARAIKQECLEYGFKHWIPWFRLHLAERDWDEAMKIAEEHRKRDKLTASYLAAQVYLAQNDPARATPEVEVLAEAFRSGKKDKQLKHRLWEVQGQLLCQTDGVDAGLKLLQRCVDETKDDYSHHAWGNGAYYMEIWGLAALHAGRYDVAEEAFLEALAHDSGSARGALGLQVMCENMGRQEEARQYAELARRFWKHAEVQTFDAELAAIRQSYPNVSSASVATPQHPTEGSSR